MVLPDWTRKLLWSSTITQGIIYIVRPMITYRALELDASPSLIGVIAALYALLPVLMALTFGRWVGVIGEGRFVIFGTLGMILNFVVSIIISKFTPPPPKHIQDLVEEIRIPRGATSAIIH